MNKEGLRQGDVLSPFWFVMVVDDVAKEVKSKKSSGGCK